ncbi:hypothetical protein JCM4914_47720 [Streptomyces platensis subsp. malvinus]
MRGGELEVGVTIGAGSLRPTIGAGSIRPTIGSGGLGTGAGAWGWALRLGRTEAADQSERWWIGAVRDRCA